MSRLLRAHQRHQEAVVDMIPFMNLLAILIPVLLVSMHYVKLSQIPVDWALSSLSQSALAEQKQVKVVADRDGLSVFLDNDLVGDGQSPTLAPVAVETYLGKAAQDGVAEELLRIWWVNGQPYLFGVMPVNEDELRTIMTTLQERAGFLHPRKEMDQNLVGLQGVLFPLLEKGEVKPSVIVTAGSDYPYEELVRVMDALRNIWVEGQRRDLFTSVALSVPVL
jgi:biopolymer transport protein ExbD